MQAGCELNNSPPYSAKVKTEWSITSSPSVCLHVKNKETFIFCTSHIKCDTHKIQQKMESHH